MFKNLFLVAVVFCSNTKYLVEDAINFLSLINNLLTLILSSADGFVCKVFWPQTHTPTWGNIAIGLTLPSYNSSLSACVNLEYGSVTVVKLPLFKPAGANQGNATLSLKEYAPGTTTDGGTNKSLFTLASNILTYG